MIISHRWGFVFVKTKKTAGTSVEIALSAVCGPEDIITPIADADERIRQGLGYRGPQNFRVPLRGLTVPSVVQGLRWRSWPLMFNHLPATSIRRVLGKARWDDYTTFTIERNPWDRAVSRYFWISRNRAQAPEFSEFLRAHPVSQFDVYGARSGLLVDRVLRYEELDESLAALWAAIGLPGTPHLPWAKSGVRPRASRDYRSFFTAADRAHVQRECHREIALLGYRF